jgi:hypothetical protein
MKTFQKRRPARPIFPENENFGLYLSYVLDVQDRTYLSSQESDLLARAAERLQARLGSSSRKAVRA